MPIVSVTLIRVSTDASNWLRPPTVKPNGPLGPMLGVPTRALYTQEAFQRVHLDVLHAAYPDARYELVTP